LSFQSPLPFEQDIAGVLTELRVLAARHGHWDELRDAQGLPRDIWQRFFGMLGEDGIARLDHGLAAVAQQVRDNDISYNVYADNGAPRAWSLDLLPFIIDEKEWAVIAAGVAQRARLLNAILSDLYGQQTLLRDGLLPPALAFGHPGYLRAVKGYVPPGGQFLQIVGLDLARGPDGDWTVLGRRTEAPSGLGYALENRLIVSGLFADAFREMRVSRLAPAYSRLIATLEQAARTTMRGEKNAVPHMALLTPGPYSETYFEHAFLARYLGLTLVEGKDLTVREDKLYLKTLTGLERVHALLRRLDDAFCDPVELRNDSTIGVPGLLQVMRAGNVMVSNVPGSGFIETPALHAFLPALAQKLLGEPLQLRTLSSWWCGEAAAMEEAFSQLDTAFLEPTWPSAQADGVPGTAAGPQKLSEWRERIERAPESFTIHAELPFSCTPHYENERDPTLGSRPAVLRVYAFAGTDGTWSVMPGGFTRLAADNQSTVSMQFGGSSADTWVLSSQPASPLTLLPSPLKPSDLAKHPRRMVSSRSAENLFWAGRYAERSENNVRLCRLILDAFQGNDIDDSQPALVALAIRSGLLPATEDEQAYAEPKAFERALAANLSDVNNPDSFSIGQNLSSQVTACSEIRARMSNDHWRTVLAARNNFRDALRVLVPGNHGELADRLGLVGALETLGMQLAAISSAHGDRMMRDEAWRLLFIGRHVERVSTMAMFLDVVASTGKLALPAHFDLLLQLFDSTFTYRSLYPGRYEVPALLDLLVVDPTNPRGLYAVYGRLREKLDEITDTEDQQHTPFAELLPPVDALPGLEFLCSTDENGSHIGLSAVCRQMEAHALVVSNEISVRYFSHANTRHVEVSP
jgi:uncharacterized circularly permuted ATP-grasp superfamily protein/uncharacterized alpha-E superfamily protein